MATQPDVDAQTAQALLAAVVTSTGAAIYTVDRDRIINSWNDAAAALYGYSAEEAIGSAIDLLLPPGAEAETAAVFERVLASGEPEHREIMQRSKDGRLTPERLTISLLRDERGAVLGMSAVAIDISEQRRTAARFRSLLEAAPDAMVILGVDGTIELTSARTEEIFGYRSEELIGQRVEKLIPQRFRAQHPTQRDGYGANPQLRMEMAAHREIFGLRKDGTEVPIEISLSPLETDEGILVSAAIRDITARKRSEEQLRSQADELARSNSELEQIAYVISHDLQEPLRTMTNYVELLERRAGAQLDDDAAQLMSRVIEGADRMQGLIKDLLAYARAGGASGPLESVDCEQVIDWVLDDLALALEDSGAQVSRAPLPVVLGDGVQLTQLFENLLSNAIKFCGDAAPEIHIGAERTGQCWTISVRDQGIGFEPRFTERIFRPFKRLHTRDEYPGTGIGLAVCLKIAERHGATIVAASEPGVGSTFSVTLLAAGDDQRPTSSPIATNAASS